MALEASMPCCTLADTYDASCMQFTDYTLTGLHG